MTELVVQWMLEDLSSSHTGSDTTRLFVDPTYPELFITTDPDDYKTRKRRLSQEQGFLEAMRSDDDDSSASSLGFEVFKRSRMSAEERRARHREAQREFAVRKKQQLDEMRRLVQTLERQLKYLELTREIAQLEADNAKFELQYEALGRLKFADAAEDKAP